MMNEWIENRIQNKESTVNNHDPRVVQTENLDSLKMLDRRTAVFQRSAGITAGSLKRCARRLGQHARVEDDDDPVVGFGTDQPAKALLELDDGFRHLVFDKWAAAAAADVIEPCLEERMAGDGEW